MKTRSLFIAFALLFATSAALAGAWGHKSFENDDALDWVENFLKPGGQNAVEKTITRVARGHGYLQAPDGSYPYRITPEKQLVIGEAFATKGGDEIFPRGKKG